MTYIEIDNLILDSFKQIPIVNSVTNNSLDWNLHKNIEYPAVAADLQNVTVNPDDGTATYNYVFTAAMIGIENETDRVANYSRMMQLLYDGIEYIKDNYDVEMPDNYTYTFGSLKYMDVLDCATCNVNIVVDMDADCELQADLEDEI